MAYTLQIGDKAPSFTNILATDGKNYSLDSINLKAFTVIFFTCNHCPYVTGSDELTRKLANQFSDKVSFIGINSNSANTYPEDAYERMKDRMEQHSFPWLYLHDCSQSLATAYGALKTPHFYLFNEDLLLVYNGRSVDTPRDTSKRTTNELQDAITQAISGNNIDVQVTNPVGCNIKWEGKPSHWMPVEACDLV